MYSSIQYKFYFAKKLKWSSIYVISNLETCEHRKKDVFIAYSHCEFVIIIIQLERSDEILFIVFLLLYFSMIYYYCIYPFSIQYSQLKTHLRLNYVSRKTFKAIIISYKIICGKQSQVLSVWLWCPECHLQLVKTHTIPHLGNDWLDFDDSPISSSRSLNAQFTTGESDDRKITGTKLSYFVVVFGVHHNITILWFGRSFWSFVAAKLQGGLGNNAERWTSKWHFSECGLIERFSGCVVICWKVK